MRRAATGLPQARGRPASPGMTLIEVMIVLMLLTIVVAGISAVLASARQSHETITGQNEVQKRAQYAVDTIVDSLRGCSEIQIGEADRLTAALKDKNGATIRTLTYYLQEGDLRRDRYEAATGQTVTGERICGNVSSLGFNYYCYLLASNSLQPPPSPIDTESFLISVTVASGKDHATETSWVKLRNKR